MHVIDTRIKKLHRCKLIIFRQDLDDPISETCYWASADLAADVQTLLAHISTCWGIEVFFGDAKELLRIDQYQLMTTTVLLRYLALCWIAFSFLEEARDKLKHQEEEENHKEYKCQHATLGQARKEVQKNIRSCSWNGSINRLFQAHLLNNFLLLWSLEHFLRRSCKDRGESN